MKKSILSSRTMLISLSKKLNQTHLKGVRLKSSVIEFMTLL